MQDHTWIVDVCADLEKYAQTHEMKHLAAAMRDAVSTARLEVILLTANQAPNGGDGSNICYEDNGNIISLRAKA